MAKRFTDTEIWSEDWFLDMPNEYKLFWFYMLANCDHAGIYKVNLRSFRGLIDPNLNPSEALKHFNNGKERIKILNDATWYIEDFIVYQYGTTLNLNNRLHESISNILKKQDLKLTSIRGLIEVKDRSIDKDKVIKKGGTGENKNGKSLKGVRFDENLDFVFFEDGSKQEIGHEQKFMIQQKRLSPIGITKGTTR
jgi:hypothetical protein